ncbi:hypothetical protein Tcan_07348 [Toxocara canis]|uniref:Uncharacterized protein n=1 Tax=Toxocara canis TaxID=6265 RepID=A0A0B2UYT1_TOXCA|nr:hypothetical protein Tcan_07348 [Toxocara canis]
MRPLIATINSHPIKRANSPSRHVQETAELLVSDDLKSLLIPVIRKITTALLPKNIKMVMGSTETMPGSSKSHGYHSRAGFSSAPYVSCPEKETAELLVSDDLKSLLIPVIRKITTALLPKNIKMVMGSTETMPGSSKSHGYHSRAGFSSAPYVSFPEKVCLYSKVLSADAP